MPRFQNLDWDLPQAHNGNIETWQHVQIAVLMDIRDELRKLNRVFQCPNFLHIPISLCEISRHTKPKRPYNRKPKTPA